MESNIGQSEDTMMESDDDDKELLEDSMMESDVIQSVDTTTGTSQADADGVASVVVKWLPEFSRTAISADPLSPAAKAWEWLKGDPLFPEIIYIQTMQRFALATLYFALNGDEWKDHASIVLCIR